MSAAGKLGVLTILLSIACPGYSQPPRMEAEAGTAGLLGLAKVELENRIPALRNSNVVASSTANALARLCGGRIAIAGAARPATADEHAACERNKTSLIEFGVAREALVIVVNPANGWARSLTLAELRAVWLNGLPKVLSWRQLNPAWPATPVKLYGPAAGSGLAALARAMLVPTGADPALGLRTDVKSTDVLSVVVEGVARDRNALGLLDEATFASNRRRLLRVAVEGLPAFPLYVYTSRKALEDPGTRAVLDHLLSNGTRFASKAGLMALAAPAYEDARRRLREVR